MRTRPEETPALAPGGDPAPDRAGPDGAVRLRPAEALWLAGAAVVMALCWAALIVAHLGVLSVPSALAVALLLLAPLALAVLRGRRMRVEGPWREVAALAAGAGLLALLYLPGFPYGAADKDPGVYMAHGFAIAREGGVRIHDEVLARFPEVTLAGDGIRLPGVYVTGPDEVTPQFYHLYPATLGLLDRIAGQRAMVNLNPLLALASVTGVYLVGRRLAGPVAGLAAAAVLGLDMIQVWQAKYPTTEVSTQLWLVLAILALVIAAETRWAPLAALGGVAVGVAWLDRADGLLVVLLALGVLAAVAVLGRWHRLHSAFALGLAVTLPHAAWQALGPAGRYSRVAAGLTPARLGLALGALALATVAGRLLWRGPLGRRVERLAATLVADERRRQLLKALLPAGLALLALVAWFRPQLFGVDWFTYEGRVVRSLDELNLRRLAWFVTVPGILGTLAGFAVVALRRWRAAVWIAVGPTLAGLVVYVYAAVNSTRLMWWSRRYVPLALLAVALLVGLAVAAAVAARGRWRWPARAAGLAVVATMVVTGLAQSLPLARHREYAGSFAATDRIAAAAGGRQGVFAWAAPQSYGDPTPLFATSVWFRADQRSLLLPPDPTPADLAAIRRAFPDQPLLVVTGRLGLPAGLRSAGLRQVDAFRLRMPFWEQSDSHRPDHDAGLVTSVSIWSAP